MQVFCKTLHGSAPGKLKPSCEGLYLCYYNLKDKNLISHKEETNWKLQIYNCCLAGC